ncbi:hypothetical protein CVU37_10300 [candidate division BRC1 bacterium HGW-BRC1-1]|jgi:uncharacterized coiled-coil protein SlyX|nr:MAG: hypothetical protein CVU37_10300 [candidate division BRC1 bacterium HGW-BRC1-1]
MKPGGAGNGTIASPGGSTLLPTLPTAPLPVDAPWAAYGLTAALAEMVTTLAPEGGSALLLAPQPVLPGLTIGPCDLATLTPQPTAAGEGKLEPLPFDSGSFTCVILCDTLDLWPVAKRPALIAEAARLTSDLLIVAGPFDTPLLRTAEESVAEVRRRNPPGSRKRAAGRRRHSLPDGETTRAHIADCIDCEPMPLPVGALRTWAFFEMLQAAAPDLERETSLINAFNAYCNARFTRWDNGPPAYRTAYVAGRQRTPARSAALASLRQRFTATPHRTAMRAIMDMLRMLGETYGEENHREPQASLLDAANERIHDLEKKHRQQERTIQKLEDEIVGVQNSRDSTKQEGILKRLFTS